MATDLELLNEHRAGDSYQDIAARHGFKVDSVRGRISRALQGQDGKVIRLDEGMYEPTARDINDMDKVTALVQRLFRLPRMVRVMLWPDLHLNDDDPQAVELAFQLEALFRPDINLFTGDIFDFDRLSLKFPRANNRKTKDVFKEVRHTWDALITRLCLQSPASAKIVIPGNHDKGRVEKYVNESAPELAETIIEAFIALVRSNNRVLWPGWTDELVIGPAMFEHGERTGESAAKMSLKDTGWSMPGTRSHTHSPTWYLNIGFQTRADMVSIERRIIEMLVTPCLCHIHPHYRKDKKKSRWVQGVATAHINLHGQDVHLRNYIFYPRADGTLVTVFGDHELIQGKTSEQQKGKAAA